jgi:hypothetical protein
VNKPQVAAVQLIGLYTASPDTKTRDDGVSQ